MEPFRIHFSKNQFADLHRRVDVAGWSHALAPGDWSLGTPSGGLSGITI